VNNHERALLHDGLNQLLISLPTHIWLHTLIKRRKQGQDIMTNTVADSA
jgi:hypothetical protein